MFNHTHQVHQCLFKQMWGLFLFIPCVYLFLHVCLNGTVCFRGTYACIKSASAVQRNHVPALACLLQAFYSNARCNRPMVANMHVFMRLVTHCVHFIFQEIVLQGYISFNTEQWYICSTCHSICFQNWGSMTNVKLSIAGVPFMLWHLSVVDFKKCWMSYVSTWTDCPLGIYWVNKRCWLDFHICHISCFVCIVILCQ